MATRFRNLSRPAISLLKSTISKPASISGSSPLSSSCSLFHIPKSSSPSTTRLSRQFSQLGALQSMLPLHTAVSSARLTSCLGMDSEGSRSLAQGMLCSANPGV